MMSCPEVRKMKTMVVYIIGMLFAGALQVAWIATAQQQTQHDGISSTRRNTDEASIRPGPPQDADDTELDYEAFYGPLVKLGPVWAWIVEGPDGPCADNPTDNCCESAEREFKEAWPFESEIIDRTFDMVAIIMGIVPDPNVPKPTVRIAEDFDDAQLEELIGSDIFGDKRGNVYSWHTNTILLSVNHADVDSLAHEMAHYFQVMHRAHGVAIWDDQMESEACRVQRHFE